MGYSEKNIGSTTGVSKIQKELMDMIRSRPDDALPEIEQVAMS